MGNGTRGFAAGFAIGANVGRNMAKDWKEAQLQEELGNASKSNQVTDQVSGEDAKANIEANFVPQEGGPQTAAEFIQQTPGVADVVAKQGAGFTTGGKSYESRDAASAAARGLNIKAMSEAYAANGRPEDAARLELQGLQLKNAERQDRAGQEEEEYQNSRKKLSEQFSGNRMYAENTAAQSKYEQDMAAYQEALKANPDNPAAAGMAPQKPALRSMTGLDMLYDANLLMQHDMKFGKVDPAKALQYQQLVGQVKKEVGTEAFKLLHTGNVQGAIDAFHAQGDIRLPEGATVEGRKGFYEVGGQKVPTNELVVKLPNGTVQVINGLQGMDALDAADKIISNNFRGAELDLSKKRTGMEGARLGIAEKEAARAEEKWALDKPEIEARNAETKKQREAREEYVAAVEGGDASVIAKARQKAVAAGIKLSDDEKTGTFHLSSNPLTGGTDLVNTKTGAVTSRDRNGNVVTPDGKKAAGPSSFATEADVGAALKAGTVKKGDIVTVGNKQFKIE